MITIATHLETETMIAPEQLRELITYDPETGLFRWKKRAIDAERDVRQQMAWNARWAGKKACTATSWGYAYSAIYGKNYKAHRMAWAIVHGTWPIHEIDHINGNRLDNRIINLRAATRPENMRNRGPRSGRRFKGIFWHPKAEKWGVRIICDGRSHSFGLFSDEVDAARAYNQAAKTLHGEFAYLNDLSAA